MYDFRGRKRSAKRSLINYMPRIRFFGVHRGERGRLSELPLPSPAGFGDINIELCERVARENGDRDHLQDERPSVSRVGPAWPKDIAKVEGPRAEVLSAHDRREVCRGPQNSHMPQ